jgi:hypothetical protein
VQLVIKKRVQKKKKVTEKPFKLINNLMGPNQEVHGSAEEMEIIKLLNTCMKSSLNFSRIRCLGLRLKSGTPMCPNILVVYRS